MDELVFRYAAACHWPGCSESPCCKIASPWRHGPSREMKSYGLACERHRGDLLDRARARREVLSVGEDEAVGPVDAFPLGRSDPPGAPGA